MIEYTKEQLHLLIHNCNVYGLGNDVKEMDTRIDDYVNREY